MQQTEGKINRNILGKDVFGTVFKKKTMTFGITKMSERTGKDCLRNLALLGQRCQGDCAMGGLQAPTITTERTEKLLWRYERDLRQS